MKTANWQASLQTLQQLQLFSSIASHSLSAVLDEFHAYDLNKGEVLLSPAKSNPYLYVVLEGKLDVHIDSVDNLPVCTLNVGDCAGEVSFIDSACPSAYVISKKTSRVLRLHRDAVLVLCQQSPALMQNLLQQLAKRLRDGNRRLVDSELHANIDSLTGAYNRRWLNRNFQREITRCAFDKKPLSLLMLDVDYFKEYNDQHGHLAGDYALCLLSHTLRNQLRTRDCLVRYGGEEFVILLPELELQDASVIGERLRESLERIPAFYSPVGMLPGITVSIGMTLGAADDTVQSMLARADSALYRAKQAGRNCISA
ncbi:GGDEF domain-containing protein [Pseudomonas marincola]|uniref:GGDEF domain-containing protein n=1 Tax=Pseudomonas marincola TaxID=437900 RepID=UPI0008E32082|nr:GGDEF domain-containing protein [Pseudomonas marincola]SFU09693.1 diguanylate cyclase (GGDEF) domain-containing protein [Pseudomonas marincola]